MECVGAAGNRKLLLSQHVGSSEYIDCLAFATTLAHPHHSRLTAIYNIRIFSTTSVFLLSCPHVKHLWLPTPLRSCRAGRYGAAAKSHGGLEAQWENFGVKVSGPFSMVTASTSNHGQLLLLYGLFFADASAVASKMFTKMRLSTAFAPWHANCYKHDDRQRLLLLPAIF